MQIRFQQPVSVNCREDLKSIENSRPDRLLDVIAEIQGDRVRNITRCVQAIFMGLRSNKAPKFQLYMRRPGNRPQWCPVSRGR